jgi:hypothetical protein
VSDKTRLERARYWIIEDIAAGAEPDEEHLVLVAELCDALEALEQTAKVESANSDCWRRFTLGFGGHPAAVRPEDAAAIYKVAIAGPVVGSWQWALEQMKAGRRVRHSTMIDGGAVWIDPNGFVDWMPDNEDDQPEDYGDNFLFDHQDFERTDWQLAEEPKA